MKREKRSPLRMILTVVTLIVAYLIVSVPFKVMEIIPGFTDIRPVSMLQPVYGIFFGIPGSLAFAVGNLITDILFDSLRWSSIAGFIANFLGPFCFYLYWGKLSRTPFALKTMKNILRHVAVIVVVALMEASIITPSVAISYPEVDFGLFFGMVMINSVAFPILLGIPLLIVMSEELGLKALSVNKGHRKESRE